MNFPPKNTPLHPGIYIRQSILPSGLSVKEAADRLGIGRPALSNLLNGRAGLSPDMAMRIEKAFQANASALLGMQAQYDEFEARVQEDNIAVRAYVPAFLQITAYQITAWAHTDGARAKLAALLRTLVHSTGKDLSVVDFPAFDNSQRPGWDGQITSDSVTPWIPKGYSGWEFGCKEDYKAKAEHDYHNRTAGIPMQERESTTFVFVTPRNWPGKTKWREEKKARGDWKDVRAFDASDLEQWLEQSPPAQVRMQGFLGGAGQGVTSLEPIWREWADITEPGMPKALFAPAVTQYQESFLDWLQASPTRPFVVSAESTLEALAFLCCALEWLNEKCPGAYEQAIVIRSLDSFKTIPTSSSNFIAIVDSAEVEQALAGLQKRTHTIIVRGRNTVTSQADIELGLLDYMSFHDALKEAGLDDPRISQLARESARSPTILRRRLAQAGAKTPLWATDHIIARALIPLIFVGAWDSSREADREVLQFLADNSYEEVERSIAELQTKDQPPVWSIGHFRGVVSKIDSLFAVHQFFIGADIKNFLIATEVTLSESDPALELPQDQRWAAELYGKSRDHSSALRQGFCDSLVLLAIHGNDLFSGRLGINLEADVRDVIHRLLTPSNASVWLSHHNELPQYAEAAPDTFLDIVESDLNSEAPQIGTLFKKANTGIFSGDCPRTGLLWALELLAWEPERLVRIMHILARLCIWKIRDNNVSAPMETLKSIFHARFPQTAASLKQRNKALEKLTIEFPEVGWRICVDQFGLAATLGNSCHKPRWRMVPKGAGGVVPDSEERASRLKAIEIALHWPSYDEHKLGDLVDRLGILSKEHRKQVWNLISEWNDSGCSDNQRAILRDRIRRNMLTQLRQRYNIDDSDKESARQTYALLKPENTVQSHLWLFLNPWVVGSIEVPEDELFDFPKREAKIARQRYDALREIWTQTGMDGVRELCRYGDASWRVGWHMAEICTGIRQATDFLQNMVTEQSDELIEKSRQCVAGFLAKLELQERDAILTELLVRLGSDEDVCVRLLRCAPFDPHTWQQIDRLPKRIKQRYWEEVHPEPGSPDASATAKFLDELLNVNRSHAAFCAVQHKDWRLIDSPRLTRLLEQVATNSGEPSGYYRIDNHCVSEALVDLEGRSDTSRDDLAQLEFLFIEALIDTERGIPNLERLLSENPELFMKTLAFAFRRSDDGEDPAEWRVEDSEKRSAIAENCYTLLTRASRIPGTKDNGSIDIKELKTWLEQVRKLTRQYGRVRIGDDMVGQLLSRCPDGDDGIWPCEPVRQAIEDIGSEDIAIGMSIGFQNARGETLRDYGSQQESGLAEQIRRWSRSLAFEHPLTANMLAQIASSYDQQAKWWDDQESVYQRTEL